MKFIFNYSLLALLLDAQSHSSTPIPDFSSVAPARHTAVYDERRKHLRQIIKRDHFSLFAQNQWEVQKNVSVGTEIFIRFPKPDAPNTYYNTEEFIILATKMNLLGALTDKIIGKFIRNAKKLDQSKGPYYINVPPTLITPDFANRLVKQIKHANLPMTLLGIELTEREAIRDRKNFNAGIKRLKDHKIAIALDDLGQENATFDFLKTIPVNRVKIDRSFIVDAQADAEKEKQLKEVIEYARHNKIEVIAEGIETEADFTFVKKHGCHGVQGYFFDRPAQLISVDA
jgi:EAL domain-containing protein (putative c-di-GMP-specific phosphodiesterase class I)